MGSKHTRGRSACAWPAICRSSGPSAAPSPRAYHPRCWSYTSTSCVARDATACSGRARTIGTCSASFGRLLTRCVEHARALFVEHRHCLAERRRRLQLGIERAPKGRKLLVLQAFGVL